MLHKGFSVIVAPPGYHAGDKYSPCLDYSKTSRREGVKSYISLESDVAKYVNIRKNPGSYLAAIAEDPIELTPGQKKEFYSIRSSNELHSWQNNVPGVWTTILVDEDRLLIRTDLMCNSLIYYDVTKGMLQLSNRIERIGSTKDADVLNVVNSMLYPGSPVPTDSTDLSNETNFLRPGCTYEYTGQHLKLIHLPEFPKVNNNFKESILKLRNALLLSVNQTVSDRIGADLSGGYDSTTLCFLLDKKLDHFTTFSGVNTDPAAHDRKWTLEALKQLNNADPILWEPEQVPLSFDWDPYRSPIVFTGRANAARIRWAAETAASQKVHVIFGGHGGDELFDIDENSLFNILPKHPYKAAELIRSYASLYRWSTRDVLREFLRPGTLRQRIKHNQDQSTNRPNILSYMPNKWMLDQWYIPPWISEQALDPLADFTENYLMTKTRQLPWVEKLHKIVSESASTTRHIRWIYDEAGVSLRCPYLDESVYRSMAQIDPAHLADPRNPKHALVESMSGLVNSHIYSRRTKDTGLTDVYRGWEKNKNRLIKTLPDWRLAQNTLVDLNALEEALSRKSKYPIEPIALWRTIATEKALRGMETYENQRKY